MTHDDLRTHDAIVLRILELLRDEVRERLAFPGSACRWCALVDEHGARCPVGLYEQRATELSK